LLKRLIFSSNFKKFNLVENLNFFDFIMLILTQLLNLFFPYFLTHLNTLENKEE